MLKKKKRLKLRKIFQWTGNYVKNIRKGDATIGLQNLKIALNADKVVFFFFFKKNTSFFQFYIHLMIFIRRLNKSVEKFKNQLFLNILIFLSYRI